MVSELDLKIIQVLKVNARASYADIGRQVGLSPSSVREHIQKLEDIGVIEQYEAKINPRLMGYGIEVFILVKIYDGKLHLALREIRAFPEVEHAHRITGPYNIHIKAQLEDQIHLQRFIDKLINYGNLTTLLILSEV